MVELNLGSETIIQIPPRCNHHFSITTNYYYGITVKFPHSPILNYAFTSWIEKTMTKTIH